MKRSSANQYKALYHQVLQQNEEQATVIILLQQTVTRCDEQQQHLGNTVMVLNNDLHDRDRQITNLTVVKELQQQTLAAQAEKIEQQNNIINRQDAIITTQEQELQSNKKQLTRLAMVKHELRLLKKMIHGRRSEKFHSNTNQDQTKEVGAQLSLNLQTDIVGVCHLVDAKKVVAHTRYNKETRYSIAHPGRGEFPEGMEEEVTIRDVQDKPAGAVLIGYEIQKQLACTPLRLFLKVTKRPIYMAPASKDGKFKQLIAPLPAHPIPKSSFDVSLLVLLVIDKYLYHLPVYRQQQRFKQYGIDLQYNTLVNSLSRIADVLEPLYNILLRELLISRYIQMDETRYRVLDMDKAKGKKSHIGWLWACGNPIQKIVAYSYRKGRGDKDVLPLLKDYTGYLQTDGYGTYVRHGRKPGVTHLQCLAHARRYFTESLENDRARSGVAIEQFFGPLYGIEKQCKLEGLCYDEITERRLEQSVPILNNFYQWLQEQLPSTLPKTPIYTAITYTLNRWKELCAYTADGMLNVDNNFMEGQVRGIAVGRKNYLFAGSHRGGERAAIMYSLLNTCKLQGIDGSKWLDDVLRRITTQPPEKLIELLPQNWKPQPALNHTKLAND